ncbi:hypothetical protein J6590_060589 [Homalodisca vitripennis]|nr:hypothetical protein J6590_060589 [Homalodisca vitripennis]
MRRKQLRFRSSGHWLLNHNNGANKEWTFLNIEDKPDNTFLGFSSNTQPSPTESINSLNSMNSGDWVNKQDDGVLWNNAICINELKLNEGNNNNDGPIPTGHSLRDMEMTIKIKQRSQLTRCLEGRCEP